MISSSKFEINATDKTFVTFASDIRDLHVAERVYLDSCDAGFTMLSEKTGKSVKFVVDGLETDSEGDIQAWKLIPLPSEVRSHRALAGWRVIVFND